MFFFCKKVDRPSTQGALCTVSVFFILHFTYLGGACAPNAPPAYGPARVLTLGQQAHVSAQPKLSDVQSAHAQHL